uniref:Uncharacterized protein n=1 Tax=Romanomermis culicivorax TaxID=13658 RepID=A0A915KU98_ROMCU
ENKDARKWDDEFVKVQFLRQYKPQWVPLSTGNAQDVLSWSQNVQQLACSGTGGMLARFGDVARRIMNAAMELKTSEGQTAGINEVPIHQSAEKKHLSKERGYLARPTTSREYTTENRQGFSGIGGEEMIIE